MDSFKDVIKVNKKALRYNLMLLKLYQNDKKSRDLKSIADLKENNGLHKISKSKSEKIRK